jgi:hypothetical protein
MDDFICEMQIEEIINEEEIEAAAQLALEAALDGQTPVIKMGFSDNEINGQLKFSIFKDF